MKVRLNLFIIFLVSGTLISNDIKSQPGVRHEKRDIVFDIIKTDRELSEGVFYPDSVKHFQLTPLIPFWELGFGYSHVCYSSEYDSGKKAHFPFGSASLNIGIKTFDSLLELSFISRTISGKTLHDITDEDFGVTFFYEDRTEDILLSNGIYVTLNPIRIRKMVPFISFGTSLNTFLNYQRNVVIEEYNPDYEFVLTNYYSDFERPKSFFTGSANSGIKLILNKRNYLKLTLSYQHYFGDKTGFQNMKGIYMSYGYQFKK